MSSRRQRAATRGTLVVAVLMTAVLLAACGEAAPQITAKPTLATVAETPPAVTLPTASAITPEPGPVTLTITGPEGEDMLKGQARRYTARLSNADRLVGRPAICRWIFYLDENNGEAFYKDLTNRALIGAADDDVCGFTSTLVEKQGKLRIELHLDVTAPDGSVIETITAERRYAVR